MKIKNILLLTVCLGLVACSQHTKQRQSPQGYTEGVAEIEDLTEESIATTDAAHRGLAAQNQAFYFSYDSYDLNQNDSEDIKIQADYLASHPSALVRLEGNTDERGSREYNVTLGWKRATAVANVLKQAGVSKSQIAVVSYGKEKPVATGHDETAYQQNRRVDLIYETK